MNLVNSPGYSSEVSLIVNSGGAIADTSWMEGIENEPSVVGFHVLKDPIIPFADGVFMVPHPPIFILDISGTWSVINHNNNLGNNNILDPLNDLDNPLNQIVEYYKTIQINYQGQLINIGLDNMYPFLTYGFEDSPWSWWDKPTLDVVISFINSQFATDFDADQLHENALILNPDMSPEKGKFHNLSKKKLTQATNSCIPAPCV